MSLLNEISSAGCITKGELKTYLLLLNPFAPHITEELWQRVGFDGMLNEAEWPKFDPAKCVDATVEIAIQICGKIRARISVPADISSADAIALAKQQPAVARELEGKTIVKELYVPGRLINIVAK